MELPANIMTPTVCSMLGLGCQRMKHMVRISLKESKLNLLDSRTWKSLFAMKVFFTCDVVMRYADRCSIAIFSLGSGNEHGKMPVLYGCGNSYSSWNENTFLSVTHGTSEPAKILEM